VLMCCDANVNYFNPYILVFCRHNHDMKCILSGRGAKAAMFYISDYITKMDVKTYEVLSLLSHTVTHVPAQTPDVSLTESAKVLLHKCLSQFNSQQQIHAQQAARYIQGFGDGILSHKTTLMLSSLLIGYVREHYPWLNSAQSCSGIEYSSGNDDDEVEPMHMMRIMTNNKGQHIDANQVHHYVYCADSLSQMNLYDFCHCVCLQTISKSSKTKNMF